MTASQIKSEIGLSKSPKVRKTIKSARDLEHEGNFVHRMFFHDKLGSHEVFVSVDNREDSQKLEEAGISTAVLF